RLPPRPTLFPYTTLFRSYVEIADTATHSRGQHLLKVGAGLKRIGIHGAVADGVRGLYTFPSLDGFLVDRPDVTRIMSGAAAVDRSEEHTSELQSPCNLVC